MMTADSLASVAELIRSGLPVPDSVTLGEGLKPVVWVRADGLGAWLSALDVVDPVWSHAFGAGDLSAWWPERAFENAPVELGCISFAGVLA